LHDIKSGELAEANRFFSRGKFVEALNAFRAVLVKMLLVVVSSQSEADEVGDSKLPLWDHSLTLLLLQIKEIVTTCREYIIGLTMETERRKLVVDEPDNVTRNLELAAYFTHCKLSSSHVQLAIRSAMSAFSKAGNHATAAVFARRLIDANPADTKVITQARAVLTQGDRNPRDAHEIAYDHFTPFEICPGSLTPIYSGSPSVLAAYTGARYLPEYKNTVCVVDGITQVGLPASGLRSLV
jgi:coatomer protein complex subunit alpha (xenin)